MSYGSIMNMPPPSREMSRKAAIVGLGETDYHLDYLAERAKAPGYESPTVEGLCTKAFERALADSGLKREDIDGLALSFTFGGPPPEEMAGLLGLNPRYCIANGNIMAGPLPVVCADIAAGKADTVAMVFCVASRTIGRDFGGSDEFSGEGVPTSYYYYHPWGWSSQAAHWAMIFSHYQATYGATEEDLGSVAMQLRKNTETNPNAVMQKPMSLEDYMGSRYIVRPLHLFDICLVNDGAVCLIVTAADRARDMVKVPVDVAGWSESYITQDKFKVMVDERLRPQIQSAGNEALAMAGLSLDDIGQFEGYDVASIHLVNQLEGFGFTPDGTGIDFCIDGQMTLGGRIPTNIAGGNMSDNYMQGWGQVPEIVRQLRGEAGSRQIAGLNASLSAMTQTDCVHPVIYTRGD